MANTFSKHHSALFRRNENERLLFVAAAGLAFSLLIILVVILNYKPDAIASQPNVPQASAPVPMGTVTLYVPDREVSAGTKLSDVTFKEVYWPRNQVPPNAVVDISEIKNQYAKISLAASVPIQRNMLSMVQGRAGLPVTPGNRAVSIEVDPTSSIEGYALPGTKVDVILTYYENNNLTSKVIVENARVLSLGGETRSVETRHVGNGPATLSKTITLDVAPQDALKIKTAGKIGQLSLTLRDPGDTKGVDSPVFDAKGFAGEVKNDKPVSKVCTKGKMRMGGIEYVIQCDGSMVRLENPLEP